MSFSANIEKQKIPVTTLVRLRPRIRVTQWLSDIGNPDIYRAAWAENIHGAMLDSATEYLEREDSEAACLANPGSYFLDEEAGGIVFNSPAADPNDSLFIVEWDVHLASRSLKWFVDPRDVNSGDRFWSGGIVTAPSPRQGNPDLIFGYSPISSTSIEVQTANGFLYPYMHSWSLYGSPIKVWECVGELAAENISELFVGTGGNMREADGVLEIEVQDPLRLLDGRWDGDTFNTDDFGGGLDPAAAGWPVREVFGYLPTFLPVNIDYNAVPATNNNRVWVVQKGTLVDSAALQTIIDWSGGSNDATHTKVADASYIMRGDNILITENAVKKPTIVISVDYGTNIITHLGIGARTAGLVDTVRRGFCSKVQIRASAEGQLPEIFYELQPEVDYTEEELANGTIGIVLVDNFEANGYSFPDTGGIFDPKQNRLQVAVYGNKTLPKKLDGVTDFGARSYYGGTAGQPVVVLWNILRNKIPAFTDIVPLDEDAWEALALAFDRVIGLAVPAERNQDFPTWKEVAQQLFQTELLRMHFKLDSGTTVLTLTQTGLAEDGGMVVSEKQVLSPVKTWDFQDIYSRLVFQLNLGELQEQEIILDKDSTYLYPDSVTEKSPLRTAAFLHRSEKNFRFASLISDEADARLVAWRVTKLIAERRGTIQAQLPISFTEESIDDAASVQLKRLTGFAVTDETRTRNYKITQHQKSAQGVSVTLDDQKAIQDSGRWE